MTGTESTSPEMGQDWGSVEGAQENQKVKGWNTAAKGISDVELKSKTSPIMRRKEMKRALCLG